MRALVLAGAVSIASVAMGDVVLPNANQATAGNGSFLGPLANAQRTYQMLIHANQLTGIVGTQITGLQWRIPPAAASAWPAAPVNFANYDIYLSGSVDPANRSLTFANNIVGPQTQVRSGPLAVAPGSYTNGSSPNAFGPVIQFTQGWTYNGGNLLVEIRHNGFVGTSQSVDAVTATSVAQGYGSQFSACWTGSYTGVSGSQGNFCVANLVPTPSAAAALGLGLMVAVRRRR